MEIRKQLIRFSLFVAFLFVMFLLPAAAPTAPAKGGASYTDEQLGAIARLTSRLFENSHYRPQALDTQFSHQLFDAYFDLLDPNHISFTAKDVAEFLPERDLLASNLKAGKVDFAFRVYDLFRRRNREFRIFAEERLKTPVDFTSDETFVPDRRKLPRPADEKELRELWMKRLKNDLLYYRLSERAAAEERARKAAEKKEVDQKEKEQEAAASVVAQWEGKSPEEKVLRRLRDIGNEIDQKDRLDILGLYLNALAEVFGPHSNYMPPKLDEDFDISMSLSLTGIGATLTSDDGYIRVVGIVPGGPAAKQGDLKVEDRIIAVAQEGGEAVDVVDMSVSNAVKLIRGPAGSKVTLTVLPGAKGRNAVPETITITRDKVELKESEASGRILTIPRKGGGEPWKIGVIELPSFYMDFDAAYRGDADFKSCTRDVRRILESFKKDKVDAVVMDLRRNGGGSLPEAILLTGLFIPTGPVVQTRTSNRQIKVASDDDPEQVYAGPLVIITSKLTASAAEIFTAALRDYCRAVVVGDSRTFGKGTVLEVAPLDRYLKFIGQNFPAGAATYETAMFYRIAGGSVQQLGIEPDIQLPSLTEQMEVGELFMDHHLPWDSIAPASYQRIDPVLEHRIALLKKASEERVAANPEFNKLKKQIELFKKFRDKKEISLNEEARWREYQQEKSVQEEADKLEQSVSGSGVDSLPGGRAEQQKDKSENTDPALREAAAVAADLAAMIADGSRKEEK